MSENSIARGKSGRGWRLLALATVIFFVAAGIYFVIVPVQESKRHEQTLIERFGWADKYTPSIDGSIPPQRVEAFIRIREAVQSHCADYQSILDDIIGLEALKDGSHPSPWPNGAGSMTRESLAPYHERLVELYCAGIVKIELLQKNRGLNFKG